MNSNIQLIQDIHAAFGRGDVPYILERVAEDVDWRHSRSPEIPYGGAYRGRDGVVSFFTRLGQAVEVTAFASKRFAAEGDEVFVVGDWAGKARATGQAFDGDWMMRFAVRGGRVAAFQAYEDTAALLPAFRS
jgi:ketosteroid isomerase-like protein